MLQAISEQVGFNYVIELVPDNNYGAENKSTKEWNGLVRGKYFGFNKRSSFIVWRVKRQEIFALLTLS